MAAFVVVAKKAGQKDRTIRATTRRQAEIIAATLTRAGWAVWINGRPWVPPPPA